MSEPQSTPATPDQLAGRRCVVCGVDFRPGEAGVVYGVVAGGDVFRHKRCPHYGVAQ